MNIEEIIADTKEFFSLFAPYVEYFCIFPERYMNTYTIVQQTVTTPDTLIITNESTKEKITLKNIKFNKETETIHLFFNDTKDELSLTTIVQNIANLLKWDTSNQIILATIADLSFSYGVKYYCIMDSENNIVDVCIKNECNCYVPARDPHLEQTLYEYFDLVS